MGFIEDMSADVTATFVAKWESRDGRQVPDLEALQLGNDAVKLTGTVLYADLAGSTKLVDSYIPEFAARIYKAYLLCASRLIRRLSGEITAFDGDRVMAVFHGKTPNTDAATCALNITWAVTNVLNPTIKQLYPNDNYAIAHGVGIDTSELFIAKTGIRNYNDLVWVGRAANYAAKLSALREAPFSVFVTDDVYKVMHDSAKTHQGQSMWEARTWNGRSVHRSSWWVKPL